jgi:hypothetical protein
MIQRPSPSFLKRKRTIWKVCKILANEPIKHTDKFRTTDRGCRPTIVPVATVDCHSVGAMFSRCLQNNSVKLTQPLFELGITVFASCYWVNRLDHDQSSNINFKGTTMSCPYRAKIQRFNFVYLLGGF